MFIHGFQTPWQIWQPHIDFFKEEYYVLIPILSGHDIEQSTTFDSIGQEADFIEKFIIDNYGGTLFAVCGISMGGTIAAELWAKQTLKIEYMYLDGAMLISPPGSMSSAVYMQYLEMKQSILERDPNVLLDFENSFMPKKYMEHFLVLIDAMTKKTIKNCVYSISDFVLPNNTFESETEILFSHGTTLSEQFSRKSAQMLKQRYPMTRIQELSGYNHCEQVLFRPEEHIIVIDQFLKNK